MSSFARALKSVADDGKRMGEPHQKWVATGKLPPEPSAYLSLADRLARAVIKKLEERKKK